MFLEDKDTLKEEVELDNSQDFTIFIEYYFDSHNFFNLEEYKALKSPQPETISFSDYNNAVWYKNDDSISLSIPNEYAINTSSIRSESISSVIPFDQHDPSGFIDKLDERIKLILNEKKDKEEKKENMKFNFDFGSCENNDNVRMSMYGIAIKNENGTFVSYNPISKEIVDVDILNFDGGKFLFKIPVSLKDVKTGDVIVYHRKPMFIESVETEENVLKVVDIYAGEKKNIMPEKSPFGFNFVTKVVSLINFGENASANAESPFGNMGILFALMNGEEKDLDTKTLMMMSMMNSNGGCNIFNSPLMMMLMMDESNSNGNFKDMLPFLLMSNNNFNA